MSTHAPVFDNDTADPALHDSLTGVVAGISWRTLFDGTVVGVVAEAVRRRLAARSDGSSSCYATRCSGPRLKQGRGDEE